VIALEQQIQSLRSQQQLSQSSSQAESQIDDCDAIRDRLIDATTLRMLVDKIVVLKKLPANAPKLIQFDEEVQGKIVKASASLSSCIGVWGQLKAATRQHDSLDNAKVALESLATQLEKKVDSCWKEWVASLRERSLVLPSVLENQKDIPGRGDLCRSYITWQKEFSVLEKKGPLNSESIEFLQDLTKKMQEVSSELEDSLPDSVKIFFKLFRDGWLPLSAMNFEVFEWLQKNDLLGHFLIRRKG
jgi:chromosome segregation ATPase